MDELKSLYFTALKKVKWQQPETFSFEDDKSRLWLLEEGSLSRLLAKECNKLSVNLLKNETISHAHISEHERGCLVKEDCLLREVILSGDEDEWVLGRTLIPLSSLEGQQHDLTRQGDIPLGLTVFNAEYVKRDELEVGWAELPDGRLLARRSRLWMNHKPMLVAELFLPNSPMYSCSVVMK